jgi:protein-disulfide isomerase
VRWPIVLVLVCSPALSRAEPITSLATDAAHEVKRVPPPPFPVRGPRFSAVTLDLYFAFGHGPSAVGAELARRAVENARAKDVRELLRLAPVGPLSNSAGAQLAAEALLEAESQGRPFEFLDRMLHEHAGLSAPELVRCARSAGLDSERLAAALADHRHQSEVERRIKESQLAGRSSGELMVNGRRSSVWISEDGLSTAIQEARKRAQLLLDDGVGLGRVYDRLTQPDDGPHEILVRIPKRLQPELSGAPSRGPSLAPVTIVVFGNLAGKNCGDTAETVRRLRQAWPGRIHEVWRNFESQYSTGGAPIEHAAALLAVAAERQNRFWELHDALLGPGPSPHYLRSELDSAARAAGIDLTRARFETAELAVQVDADRDEARRLNVSFTPAVLVNGLLFSGASATSFERLDRAVRTELERGLADRLAP